MKNFRKIEDSKKKRVIGVDTHSFGLSNRVERLSNCFELLWPRKIALNISD